MADTTELDLTVTLTLDGLSDPEDKLRVLRFGGEEAISQLFRFDIDFAFPSAKVDLQKVVGKGGQLVLEHKNATRYVHGIIASIQQREKGRHFTVYHAVLVPKAWRLQHKQDCRVYQDEEQNAKKIIVKLLKDEKIDSSFKPKGNVDPPKRTYSVQYRESYWNYISRLLEEEGYFYYFEHEDNKHTCHIANDSQFHPDIPGDSTVTFRRSGSATTPGEEHVFAFNFTESVQSGKVTLNEFNFEKPNLPYIKDKEAKLDTDLEVYDYPGLYALPEQGPKVAEVRLQEIQGFRQVVDGAGDSIRFCAGYLFKLKNHDRDELNKKQYLLTKVSHVGEKSDDLESGAASKRIRYHNTFTCVPQREGFTYRPPRTTHKPRIVGTQTAIVVTPGDQEIHTDKYGRVKVQFHWDRLGKKDDKSSCWIRVAQIWAGAAWGAMYIPRKDQEVVVDFIEGDPDRPIIIGRVYHAKNLVPYDLPEHKTRSTIKSNTSEGGDGFNEIRFEDKKGSEELFTHAQKDQNEVVKNNMSTSVGGSQTRTVAGNRTLTIKKGDDKLTVVKGSRSTTVKQDATLTIQEGSREVDVTSGNYMVTVHGGNVLGTADEQVDMWGKKGMSLTGDTEGVTITGNAKGVNVYGTGGKGVHLDGSPNVDIKGSSKVKASAPTVIIDGRKVDVKGSAEVKLGGGAVVKISGTSVTVEGTSVTIKGTMVKIN